MLLGPLDERAVPLGERAVPIDNLLGPRSPNRLDKLSARFFRKSSANSVVMPTTRVNLPGGADTEGFSTEKTKILRLQSNNTID